ncbi:MAG: GDP-mannose 4,6-dehydratase [Candidatus Marinimicrobia bacterium]|nr:GDP-mannose 4,6-dehydratase [Candidatus Neomarinimicrobiota bacterium]
MKALVTGGAGFIGSHLSEKLIEQGDYVTVIDDLSTGNFNNIKHLTDNPHFNFAIETILDELVIDRLVSECDIIYHLAAVVGVELVVKESVRTIETNVLGTTIMLKTANRYKKRIILTSTSEIYGKGVNDSFGENDDRLMGPIVNSRWIYACSKSLDEFLALAYFNQKKLPVVICRLFNTIGPRQTGFYGMVVPRFIRQGLTGKDLTVYGDGRQSRCFCNVTDVVEALILLSNSSKADGEVYNIGSTQSITICDLAKKIISLTNNSLKIIFVPYEEAYGEGFEDMLRRKPNIKKIHNAFNWQPRISLDDSLQSIIEYEKDLLNIPQ